MSLRTAAYSRACDSSSLAGGRVRLALPWLLVLMGSVVLLPPAGADGGHMALHATSGPYTVTLFTTPVPLATGGADFTLLVQPAEVAGVGGSRVESLPGATASGMLELPSGGARIPLRFNRAGEGSALLTANGSFALAGNYALTLAIAAPGQPAAVFHTVVPVARDHGRRETVLLMLLLPVVAIALFLVNQQAKSRGYSRS